MSHLVAQEIPKIIHISWNNKDLLKSNHPLILNGIGRLHALNTEWDIQINDDADIRAYIKEKSQRAYELMKGSHIVHACDLWRLLKIYHEGGMYVDIDRLCNRELKTFITPKIKWVLPIYKDFDFSQDTIISAPGNPVIQNVIDLFLKRKEESISTGAHRDNIYFFGAQTYMHAITKSLLGEMINSDPGAQTMANIGKYIKDNLPFVYTEREDPPYNTMLYKGDTSLDLQHMKRDFYIQSGIGHWTGAW